jgi:hypothetical protein
MSENKLLKYTFNEKNKQSFLTNTEDDAKESMQKLLNCIKYIPHEIFIEKIRSQINEIYKYRDETNNKINIFLNQEDYVKSSYWISNYIDKFIKEKDKKCNVNIIDKFNINNLKDNSNVFVIDDCIYSGQQMSSTISKIRARFDNTMNKKINILLFTPYISEVGLNRIMDQVIIDQNSPIYKTNFKFFYDLFKYETIVPLSSYLTFDDAYNIAKYYPFDNTSFALSKYPIYFDHKVADSVSTFPYIFSGIVANLKNKKIITDIFACLHTIKSSKSTISNYDTNHQLNYITKTVYINEQKDIINKEEKNILEYKKQLQFIPLLNHCDSARDIDLFLYNNDFPFESVCPLPPYKPDYDTYYEQKKKNMPTDSHTPAYMPAASPTPTPAPAPAPTSTSAPEPISAPVFVDKNDIYKYYNFPPPPPSMYTHTPSYTPIYTPPSTASHTPSYTPIYTPPLPHSASHTYTYTSPKTNIDKLQRLIKEHFEKIQLLHDSIN